MSWRIMRGVYDRVDQKRGCMRGCVQRVCEKGYERVCERVCEYLFWRDRVGVMYLPRRHVASQPGDTADDRACVCGSRVKVLL